MTLHAEYFLSSCSYGVQSILINLLTNICKSKLTDAVIDVAYRIP